MMIQAVLSNHSHPEYGVATIPFPIPHDQYAHCMELLAALEIGDAAKADCKVEDTEHITWLYLPMIQEEIDRALLRGGITGSEDVRLRLEDSQLPNEVDVLLDMEYETLSDLNELAEATDGLSKADIERTGTVVMLAEPKSAAQIKNLAESLDLFDFAPGAHTPQDYGKYMIRQSGHFDYDENLDAFYDYEKYGTERMNAEDGALLTYAAVLEAEKPETLHRACELLQDLDNYRRITEDAYGYGQQRLQETLGLDDEAIYELDGYMDFEKYGQDCMENDCVTEQSLACCGARARPSWCGSRDRG